MVRQSRCGARSKDPNVYSRLEIKPAGLILGFEIWRLNGGCKSSMISFFESLVSRMALWNEPNIELKCHGVLIKNSVTVSTYYTH